MTIILPMEKVLVSKKMSKISLIMKKIIINHLRILNLISIIEEIHNLKSLKNRNKMKNT
jgi:hypothetical protein